MTTLEKTMLDPILELANRRGASDTFLIANEYPVFQIGNESVAFPEETHKLHSHHLEAIVEQLVATPYQKKAFEKNLFVQFSHVIPNLGRYRFQVCYQRSMLDISIRRLMDEIPTLKSLNLPVEELNDICESPNGIVLIAGATDVGKSTTQAAMAEHINSSMPGRRITIVEQPREFFFRNKGCYIKQKEVGRDVRSYSDAAQCALRENTNVLVFGECFDASTARALLRAGNSALTFTTIHASSASAAINGLVYMLPEVEREESRLVLSNILRAVVFQVLVKTLDDTLYPCLEIIRNNSSIGQIIRNKGIAEDGRPMTIDDYLERHGRAERMQSLFHALKDLALVGGISEEEAIRHSPRKRDMELALKHGLFNGLEDEFAGGGASAY